MAKEFYIVDSVCSANKFLPTPLEVGEVVQRIEEDESEALNGYMKVYHNEGKAISRFSSNTFKRFIPKDKTELVYIIKNKGRRLSNIVI